MRTDDLDAVKEKLYSESEPFLVVHPNYDLSKLPSWVVENIEVARVYGNSKKGIILPDGRKYHLDNHLNDLTGREWTFFINSVFSTHYPTSGKEAYAHHIRKIHPTPKPPQLMRDLIQFFTKENELVFDSFMGVGGTLLGAALCNRTAVGIDLNQDYLTAYHAAAAELGLEDFTTECGDCLAILRNEEKMTSLMSGKEISLLLFDPPYSNMMSKEKTGADIAVYGKTATPFSDSEKDLGNMERPIFLSKLRESVELALPYIKFRGYVVLFIKDLQPSKKEPVTDWATYMHGFENGARFVSEEYQRIIKDTNNQFQRSLEVWKRAAKVPNWKTKEK